MTGGAVEAELADVGRVDLIVSSLAQFVGYEVLQFSTENSPVGSPEDHAGANGFIDMEELEFFAEFSVISCARLLHAFEVFCQFFFVGKGGTVDALELLVVLVSAMVGTGDGEEFESFDFFRVADMGSGAEVDKFSVLVKADLFAFGDVVETAQFVALLSGLLDFFDGFFSRAFNTGKLLVLFDDFFHFGLDGFEVGGIEFFVQIDVVVKAVIGGWTDVELSLRVEAQHSGGEHV